MEYKGLIYTDHIIQRLKERSLSYDYIYWVWKKPDRQESGGAKDSYKYMRQNGNNWFVVVAKKNERGQWVLLTCWQKPINEYHQSKHNYQPESLLKKIWKMIIGKY